MVNLATIAVACVSVWYEATPPNAAAGFLPRRRRFWYKTAACITGKRISKIMKMLTSRLYAISIGKVVEFSEYPGICRISLTLEMFLSSTLNIAPWSQKLK